MDANELRELGQQFRVDSIRPAAVAKSGHPTSGMSAADLMAVLVANHLPLRLRQPEAAPTNDRLIFSKGHASTLLYAIFRAAGAITDEELLTYRKFGSMLEGHPTPLIPWVDVATGSLGQGLPIGVGMALAAKYLDRLPIARLGALRRQRDGRGLDVGGVRARVALRARQPDRDHRRQPARPARRDDDRLEHRRLRRTRARRSAGTRSRSTATTSRRSTARTRRRPRRPAGRR